MYNYQQLSFLIVDKSDCLLLAMTISSVSLAIVGLRNFNPNINTHSLHENYSSINYFTAATLHQHLLTLWPQNSVIATWSLSQKPDENNKKDSKYSIVILSVTLSSSELALESNRITVPYARTTTRRQQFPFVEEEASC